MEGAKDFCWNFFKLVVRFFPTNFLPQRLSRPFFWCDFQKKKRLHLFFCKCWAPFSEGKQRCVPFLPGFSGILTRFPGFVPGYSANQKVGGALSPLAPPFPTPLDQNVGCFAQGPHLSFLSHVLHSNSVRRNSL